MRIRLALAVCEQPVSVDTLVEWGLARPSELFLWLDRTRARGEVLGEASGLVLEPKVREHVLLEATEEDFRGLVSCPALIQELLGVARREATRRGSRLAKGVFRAVFSTVSPEDFPGGHRGFVAAVVEAVRLHRMWGILGPAVDQAIDLATRQGDLGSQAQLLAGRALGVILGQLEGDSQALLVRAREAAEAVGGEVRVMVLVYTAISRVFTGNLREGIAAFEELLGDVPAGLLTAEGHPLLEPDDDSATPGAAVAILATAYSDAGQHPRALELLHQLRDLGIHEGRPRLVEEANLFLGLIHVRRNEHDVAREWVRASFERFCTGQDEPGYGWFAALAWGVICARDERLDEAREAWKAAVEAWERSAQPPVGAEPYELFERFEAAGQALPPGLDLLEQAQRSIHSPLVHVAGQAHHFLARRLLGEGADAASLEKARQHLNTAAELLRQAGAAWDLSAALNEAARLARRQGDEARAQRLRSEADVARPSGPSAPVHEAARLRSVVLDLGRLPLSGQGEGFWGTLCARLCEGLGAERCAVVELDPPRLLAARGGTRSWQEALLGCEAPSKPTFSTPPESRGQRVLIPFAAPELGRRGLLALENTHASSSVRPGEEAWLEALGVQLGVLLSNLTLWAELSRARERLEHENRYFRETAPAAAAGSQMVAHSPAMREVLALVARAAPSKATVLITGETGVGKELVAHEVHRRSPRRDRPLIAVHIASLAPGLVSSGLFGHERGAFTGASQRTRGRFELADGGTLFLDEVGELPFEDQVKLLRVLQEGTFERVGGCRPLRSDFRLVAATNRDLEAEVRAGRFREDLYYRLCAFPVRVPPLRERREEIPTLALFFMERAARQRGVCFEGIGEADMERLTAWDWPGNVRELEHVVERACLLSEPPRLRIPPLEGALRPAGGAAAVDEDDWPTLAEMEARYVLRVLEHTGGRVSGAGGAAEALGLKPSTLNFRVRKLGLTEQLGAIRTRAKGG